MSYTLVTPPSGEPVSLPEAKAHCRVDHSDDDVLITALIVAAREMAERTTRRSFVTQTWRLELFGFPGRIGVIPLAHGPVQSVTGIAYRDTDNVLQTLSPAIYALSNSGDLPTLWPAVDEEWPDYERQAGAVRVTFVAGYGDFNAVPDAIKQALLLLIGHWYSAREAVSFASTPSEVPWAADALLGSYRIPLLA